MITLMMSVFLGMQIIDCLQTSWIVNNGGIVQSQTVLKMYHQFGVGLSLALIKGALVIGVLLAWSEPVTFVLCLLYAMKIGHNVYATGELI